jgi:multidrug transporter EmrE-like cation transporter
MVALLIACIILSAGASICLKIGASTLINSLSLASLFKNYMVWLGGAFYASSFFGYIYVLRTVPLSLAQPVITAGVSAVTALVAILFFREQMSLANWMGLLLISIGIFFLFWGKT